MADILNSHGYRTYFISVHKDPCGHDSTAFHHAHFNSEWNLTGQFDGILDSDRGIINKLKVIKRQYNLKGCLATGSKAFLLASAGIKYNYWSYGSDLDQVCFYQKWPDNYCMLKRIVDSLTPTKYRNLSWSQKVRLDEIRSISDAKTIYIAPYQIDSYLKICPRKVKSFFPHFFPKTDYDAIIAKKHLNRNIVKKSIGIDRFFFSSTRHFWHVSHYEYSDNKRNDIIFHAFAKYLQITADAETKLVLIAKGPDVAYSETLVRELGLSGRVVWIDEMNRDELQTYYSAAQIAFGQFGTPVLAFSALEPLTVATPCVSFFWDGRAQGVPFYEKSPPILNTKDPDQIAEYLALLMANNDRCRQESYAAWQWIQDNCLEINFAKKLSSLLSKTNAPRKFTNFFKRNVLSGLTNGQY